MVHMSSTLKKCVAYAVKGFFCKKKWESWMHIKCTSIFALVMAISTFTNDST